MTRLLAAFALLAVVPQDDRKTWESREGQAHVRIPEFIWKALSSPGATKLGLWTGSEGQILRYSVHVDKGAMPEWIHALADQKIGKGEDLEYEIEIYPDGAEVYEIYRRVDGLEKQLSVKADKTVYYIGTEVEPGRLPDAAASALRTMKGVTVGKIVLKEGPSASEIHVKAVQEGAPVRLRMSKSGRLLAVQRKIAAEIEVPTASP